MLGLILIIVAALYYFGIPGWGWFAFIALLFWYVWYMTPVVKEADPYKAVDWPEKWKRDDGLIEDAEILEETGPAKP